MRRHLWLTIRDDKQATGQLMAHRQDAIDMHDAGIPMISERVLCPMKWQGLQEQIRVLCPVACLYADMKEQMLTGLTSMTSS